jgi:hypothetical protein
MTNYFRALLINIRGRANSFTSFKTNERAKLENTLSTDISKLEK